MAPWWTDGFVMGKSSGLHPGRERGSDINKCLTEWVTFLLGECPRQEDVAQPINSLQQTRMWHV